MNLALALKAALLGFIEGLTEFLPVSSTGHLILFGHYLGFESPGHSFEVLIQLGAILAILSVYFGKLWYLAKGMFSDRKAQMFIAAVLLAFLPAVVIGVFAHSFIKGVLFTPFVVCVSLISGGLILLVVDETRFETKIHDVMDIPLVTLNRSSDNVNLPERATPPSLVLGCNVGRGIRPAVRCAIALDRVGAPSGGLGLLGGLCCSRPAGRVR